MNLPASADDVNIVALPVPTDQTRRRPILGGVTYEYQNAA
jgi:hypothetical protein